ncbi:DUF4870 family protein [Thiolapillus sp.]|uniref:DUF4870 family protein n=1 Tax=Thiolapillus sp. TaxID=2017437 RepID=UPI003AF6AC3E
MTNGEQAITKDQQASDTPMTADAAKKLTHILYALYAASFLLGITGLFAIIINYVKRADVKGTIAESHFRWQIRTFWFSLLWVVVGAATAVVAVGYFILIGVGIWNIYRIVVGWFKLSDGKPMYQ